MLEGLGWPGWREDGVDLKHSEDLGEGWVEGLSGMREGTTEDKGEDCAAWGYTEDEGRTRKEEMEWSVEVDGGLEQAFETEDVEVQLEEEVHNVE